MVAVNNRKHRIYAQLVLYIQIVTYFTWVLNYNLIFLCMCIPLLKNSGTLKTIQFKLGVYTYCVSVQNWFAFGPRWPNFGPLVATNYLNWWFLTVIWKIIHTIKFKLSVYTCRVSVHNWFGFGPRWPNFRPLVSKRLMKLGDNGCFWPPPA